jgi:hypothetical protein
VPEKWQFLVNTLLLTLSNLAFVPAVALALRYGLFAEALTYMATMVASTFYHTCDQEALTSRLPHTLERACIDLYVNREVLQFLDFYCAVLSFWLTTVSLARLPPRVAAPLHVLGVLLAAGLIQYSRTGAAVLAVPIPLGLLVAAVAAAVRHRRRCLRLPRRLSLPTVLLAPAAACAIAALALFAFVESASNYATVHSIWHILLAASLALLLPRCRRKTRKEATSTEDVSAAVPSSRRGQGDVASDEEEEAATDGLAVAAASVCPSTSNSNLSASEPLPPNPVSTVATTSTEREDDIGQPESASPRPPASHVVRMNN